MGSAPIPFLVNPFIKFCRTLNFYNENGNSQEHTRPTKPLLKSALTKQSTKDQCAG
jgi:hypothetical protein